MNNKLLALFGASLISVSSFADISITGAYEGTISNSTGASTYADDLDLTIKGRNGDTTVTATLEDMSGGQAVTSTQVYIDTKLEGINFRGGNYKGQNGNGLLQKKSAASNKMKLSTDIAGVGLAVSQSSGDGNAKVDASFNIEGVSVNAQNVNNDTRFVSASAKVGAVSVDVETQEASAGKTNTAYALGADYNGIALTYVNVDIEDATGVTQDDGILGNISDATAGKDLYGVVGSLATDMGKVTGRYVSKNDLDIYTAKLERGIWSFSATDTEGEADLAYEAKMTVTF